MIRNVLERSYAEVAKKMAALGFLLNIAVIVTLYFFSNARLPLFFYLGVQAFEVGFALILKALIELLQRRHGHESMSLIIVEDLSEFDLVNTLRRIHRGRVTVITYSSEKMKKLMGKADNIYLAGSLTSEVRNMVVTCCTLKNKRVYIIPEAYEIAVRKSRFAYIGDIPAFLMESYQLTDVQKFIKRSMDIALALSGIVLTLPLFFFAAIAIKREHNGPILFQQVRTGLNGQLFKVIKFRSMVVDAERDTGAVLAKENDFRITKIGWFLRASRIDELPQFFNVLAGSMSVVGPRPERPIFVEEFQKRYPDYRYRFSVKPGITGLAQVKGKYSTTVENKLKFDLMYLVNYSILLDLKIIMETVKVVLNWEQAKGINEEQHRKFVDVKEPRKRHVRKRIVP